LSFNFRNESQPCRYHKRNEVKPKSLHLSCHKLNFRNPGNILRQKNDNRTPNVKSLGIK
jgi:hypothetical protein